MASTSTTLFLFFTLFTTSSLITSGDNNFLAPLLSPLMDDICNSVGCGKGKCKISDNDNDIGLFGFPSYECECNPGWKQMFASHSNSTSNSTHLKFLPCVIPNCTLDFSCSEAAPPAQSKETTTNTTIFDPCSWANCGGGICNKTSALTYNCICKDGYYNLFNSTNFPCFKECSIGGDCSNLGIAMGDKPTAPSPNLPDKSANQARVIQYEVFYGMIMLALAVFRVL